MGQALYRKYRSKSLSEVVGQEHITETLATAISSDRISHAYLFTGPRGIGKTSIARILAHDINGLPYDESAVHIDIIEIDAASNRRIDEIRELRDKIHVAPALAKYKVYIIDEVHMLTREAFNALLKTLEEPPAHAVFILATTEAHKLPDTIVSRTQRYIFRPIEPTKAIEHLKYIAKEEKIAVTDDALALIVEHGSGSFRDSISLLDQLSNSGHEIDLATVQQVLGIAPSEAIEQLLSSIRASESAAHTYQQLAALFTQGYQPANVARQLAAQLRQQLTSGTAITTNDLALLSALLEVPLSHDPEGLLEIALLGYSAVTPATPALAQTVPSPKSLKPLVAEPTPTAEPVASVEPATAPTHAGDTLDPDSWQAVLNLLKKQHNTLYGIVRMAQPDFSAPGQLQLSFGFAFHQKRANEAKNRQIIGDAIVQVTGSSFAISCTYDSTAKAAQPVLAGAATSNSTPSETSPLTTISNIFGGVEMVE